MTKRKFREELSQTFDNEVFGEETTTTHLSTKRRCHSVIDSLGDSELIPSGYSTPQRRNSEQSGLVSPDQGCYSATPGSAENLRPEWMKASDQLDTSKLNNTPSSDENVITERKTARMPIDKDSHVYNMNHKNRGKCIVFNHETFNLKFEPRRGTKLDADRIERTFQKLGFDVEICYDWPHSDIMEKIDELSKEDHSDNDCICIFVLTHGLRSNMICSKDVAYSIDNIWKPFTGDKCNTLAGKPKLLFIQACRGDNLDSGITLQRSSLRTVTDGVVTTYKIPSYSDFLIAHSTVEEYVIPTHTDILIAHSTIEDFSSWRNPEEGSWYIQCLCSVIEEYAETTDLVKMLTITNRKVATEYASYDDRNLFRHDQKQVPSFSSMLIRDLFFTPKKSQQ